MAKTKYNAKEIGRISLGENQDFVVNLIDDERLDIRVYVNSERYTGPTKRGVRFYLFPVIRILRTSAFVNTMQTVGEIALLIDKEKPEIVRVDTIGVGAGVYDRLREQKYPVEEFVAGAGPKDNERYLNLRTEAHWLFRERLEAGNVDLPDDSQLTAQLSGIQYKIRSDKKIQVESKEEMKKRGLKSPDKADAVIMAFIGKRAKRRNISPTRGVRRLVKKSPRYFKVGQLYKK
jgi:hypothetical protein